jgi:hypothetical protein
MNKITLPLTCAFIGILLLTAGCRTTTVITRANFPSLPMTTEEAVKVVTTEIHIPSESLLTCDFDADGFVWTEYTPPPAPIYVAPTSTTLYSPSGGGIVAQTYTTPGYVIPSRSSGSTDRGRVTYDKVDRISQIDSGKQHWLKIHAIKPKRNYLLYLGQCSTEQATRAGQALLVLCPNVK